ncbi:hypothetical protein ACI3PL_33215, partial [Lacticaseibacillus paracasei]
MLIVHEFMNAEDMANSPVGENLAKFLATAVLTGCQIMWYNQDKTATITMLIVHEFMNAEDMANS